MERLPDKLLGEILGLIPRRDQLKMFRVSKRWNKVMDELVGIDLKLGRGVITSSEEEVFDWVKIMETVGVRSCVLDFYINESTTAFPKLKHPNLLKFVSFQNFISTTTFEKILTGALNLQTFEIDRLALYHLDLFDCNLVIPCQVLNVTISEWRNRGSMDMDLEKYEVLSINLAQLLRKSFPGLKRTNLYLDAPTELREFLSNEIAHFLGNHSETLAFIDISIGIGGMDYFEKPRELKFVQTLPKLVAKNNIRFTRLRKLEVEAASQHLTSYSDKKHWMEWATQVENMEDAYFAFDITQSLLKSIAEKNATTLRKLKLYLERLNGWPYSLVDCKTLQICSNLQSLTIGVCRGGDLYDKLTVYQAHLLPKSLIQLKIENIQVNSECCKSICLNLPKMEDLMLQGIGSRDGHGVPVSVVAEMISQKKVKKFYIQTREEANEHALVEPFSSGKHNYQFRSVLCTLDDNGEYVRKYKEDFS